MSDSLKETPTFPSETSNQDDSTVLEKTEDNTQSNGSNTNPKDVLDKEQMDGINEESDEEEEEEEEDDDFEVDLSADNMKKTNVGDSSDVIKQKKLAQTQATSSTGQPIQVVGSAPSTNTQLFNMFTNVDPEALKRLPDIDSIDDKPWTKPGADISDYFNYDLTEDTWRLYLMKHAQMRQEFQHFNKIKVFQGNKEDKDFDKGDKRSSKYRDDDMKMNEYDKRRIHREDGRGDSRGYRDDVRGYRDDRGYREDSRARHEGRGSRDEERYDGRRERDDERYGDDWKKQDVYYGGQRHHDDRGKPQRDRSKRDRYDYNPDEPWESDRKRRK